MTLRFPQPLLRTRIPFLSTLRLSPSPSLPLLPLQQCRNKVTIGQILRGARVPPKSKRIRKSEAPDLRGCPLKKAVIQKVYITKPKVSLQTLHPYINLLNFPFALVQVSPIHVGFLGQVLMQETQFCAKKNGHSKA